MPAHHTAAAVVKPAGIFGKAKYYATMGYDACRHLYHGFQLFGTNTKVAWKIKKKLQKGSAITRRERLLLEKATEDLLRLVPFSVFIIVPGAEVLLPVALKMFPNLIPSTFETESQGRNTAFSREVTRMQARRKLEEHMTMQVVAISHEHSDILRRVSTADKLKINHIRQISPLFVTGQALGFDNLPPHTIKALAQFTGEYKSYHALLPTAYATKLLRDRLQQHFKMVQDDDRSIYEEGLGMLTQEELVQANQRRGMRWVDGGHALVSQLQDWVELSRDEHVPFHVLYFVRPTYHSIQSSFKGLDNDTRQKLLGLVSLPVHVRASLLEVCNKIDSREDADSYEEDFTADELSQELESVKAKAKKALAHVDLSNQNALAKLAEYLASRKFRKVFEEIFAEVKQKSAASGEKQPDDEADGVEYEKEPTVTTAAVIDHLARKTQLSTHVVSTIFEALDESDETQELTLGKCRAIFTRLRDKD